MTLKLMVVHSCTSYISNTIYMQTSPKFMSLDLQISSMDLSRLYLESSLDLSSKLQTCLSNCLLNISIWMAHKYMKLNITPNFWFLSASSTCTKYYSPIHFLLRLWLCHPSSCSGHEFLEVINDCTCTLSGSLAGLLSHYVNYYLLGSRCHFLPGLLQKSPEWWSCFLITLV